MNTFGTVFRLTTYGESHGPSIGGVIDGCPAGFKLDLDAIQSELDKRKPGQSKLVTQRKESDTVIFQSGIFDGKTTGTPIGFTIQNENQKSKDYEHLKDTFRPSHADFTYQEKYGVRDYNGGGRSSARETACRVVAGAIAKQILQSKDIHILSYVDQVGDLQMKEIASYTEDQVNSHPTRCPNPSYAVQFENKIAEIKKQGNTIGGCIKTIISGVPAGLGEPVFDKINARLAAAMIGINAAKGIEFGAGFDFNKMTGIEANDEFVSTADGIKTKTNHSGGIQGGISNGMPIEFRTVFKPVATIMKDQNSVDKDGNITVVSGKGRHDACVLPRAVPIVNAMSALVLLDFLMLQQAKNIL